ncbi:MAG: hypothetical protein JO079_04490 [Frankiaceae bacterium]|nr:hypothetical protein [Frankiaceae bacterium]
MAQDAVDAVAVRLGIDRPCPTATLPLVGVGAPTQDRTDRLERRFGAEAAAVASVGETTPIADGVPAFKCEAHWAVQAEGAITTSDVERRLRLDLVPAWASAARPYVEQVVPAGDSAD